MTDLPNNEELAAFVSSTLRAITKGVEQGNERRQTFTIPEKVNFEVAVRATKNADAGGGLKIQVFNAEGKISKADELVSKISFSVGTYSQANISVF